MGLYSVIRPRAATNLITNPSFETNTTGWTAAGGTIGRVDARARYGAYSLNVTPTAGVNDGAYYTIALAAASQYVFTIRVFATEVGVPLVAYVYNVTTGLSVASTAFNGTGTWQEISVTAVTVGSNNYRLYVAKNGSASTANWYLDGAQLETTAGSTYIDGDIPGCMWNGARHASTSVRSGASRNGGDVVDLEDLMIFLLQHSGGGMAPVMNITSDYGLLPGSTYQRTKVMGRLLTLTLDQDDSQAADAWQALHDVRRSLIELFDPYGVEGSQPTTIRYTGGSEVLALDVFYDAGLEGGDAQGFIETATLRLLAPQPFWRQIGNQAKTLSVNETFADADLIVQRSANGLWGALAGGLQVPLANFAAAVLYARDKALYVAGSFGFAYNAAGTGSSIAAAKIAKWDGSAWSIVGASGADNTVYALAEDAAGNIYAAGLFTTIGGVAANRIAVWNGTTWAALGTGLNGECRALAIGTNGDVYAGGLFTSAGGVANTTYVAKWNGSAWEALGTGVNDEVYALAVGGSGNVTVGGKFTTAGGSTASRIARWFPSNSSHAPYGTSVWRPISVGIDNNIVQAIALSPDGTIYVGGTFTLTANHPQYIARTTDGGAATAGWLPLGSDTALNNAVYALHLDSESMLYAGGAFTTVNGIAWPDALAQWRRDLNWAPFLIDLPGTSNVRAITSVRDGFIEGYPVTGRIAIAGDFNGTATASNISDTTITNNGSAPASPVIRITGPGVLESFTNMTTGRRIDFNGQQLQAGEVATLDLRPGQLSFTTTTGRNLLNSILSSHPTSFRLLRGDNTILVKMRSTTGASAISVTWQELHWSYDV